MDKDEQDREDSRVRDAMWMIEKCRELGGIDLDREKRTIGFERRRMRPDRRPTTGSAWGEAPQPRDAYWD